MSIVYLARGLAAKGHEISVGCPGDTLLSRLLTEGGVRVVPMPFRSKFDLRTMRLIRDTVRERHVHIVNAQASRDRYLSIFAVRLHRLPVRLIHTRRQMPSSSGGTLQSRFYQWGTDRIVAVSTAVKEGLVRLGIAPEHITVIHNGTPPEKYTRIDNEHVERLGKRYGIGAGESVVGCVARRSKRKHQDQLLIALRDVPTPTTVLLVGATPCAHLRGLARSLEGRHRVIFGGVVPPSEALACYKLFTMLVLPSTMEGLSQSLLEAMALGVPVIATRAGGNPDVVRNGRNGWLFDDGDVGMLAEHIKTVQRGGSRITAMTQHARSTALERFHIEHTIIEYERFFRGLLQNPVAIPSTVSHVQHGPSFPTERPIA